MLTQLNLIWMLLNMMVLNFINSLKGYRYRHGIPTSRTTFKEYCLRNLGKGVIDINVSDDQAEDRIDEALQYFAQYHYDGVERMYLKHEITQADVDRSKTNDTTTATTDVRDGSVTASFTEGRGFIPIHKLLFLF